MSSRNSSKRFFIVLKVFTTACEEDASNFLKISDVKCFCCYGRANESSFSSKAVMPS